MKNRQTRILSSLGLMVMIFLRGARKLKAIGKQIKMKHQFRKFDFRQLIDRIVELDENHDKYLEVLLQPWFIENKEPINVSLENRWIEYSIGNKN